MNLFKEAFISLVTWCLALATIYYFFDLDDAFKHAPSNEESEIYECIDTRDGQQFSFNTGTAFDIGSEKDWQFKVKTTDGEIRTFTPELLTVIKCRSGNETI